MKDTESKMGGNAMYCHHCGAQTQEGAVFCSQCGTKLVVSGVQRGSVQSDAANAAKERPPHPHRQETYIVQEVRRYCKRCGGRAVGETCSGCGADLSVLGAAVPAKSRLAAGLLGIFLGGYGVHNFYMGYYTKAIVQVCLSGIGLLMCFTIIGMILGIPMMVGAGIWGLVEGILALTGNPPVDAHGVPIE